MARGRWHPFPGLSVVCNGLGLAVGHVTCSISQCLFINDAAQYSLLYKFRSLVHDADSLSQFSVQNTMLRSVNLTNNHVATPCRPIARLSGQFWFTGSWFPGSRRTPAQLELGDDISEDGDAEQQDERVEVNGHVAGRAVESERQRRADTLQ